jgi:hypothetical protein
MKLLAALKREERKLENGWPSYEPMERGTSGNLLGVWSI